MRYELKGSLTDLVDECADPPQWREFDLGFGLKLKACRLHSHNLRRFQDRLQDVATTTRIPMIFVNMIEDVMVCKAVLIIKHSQATFVHGSPYEMDMDRPWGLLGQEGSVASDLQEALRKFDHPLYSAAGQTG